MGFDYFFLKMIFFYSEEFIDLGAFVVLLQ